MRRLATFTSVCTSRQKRCTTTEKCVSSRSKVVNLRAALKLAKQRDNVLSNDPKLNSMYLAKLPKVERNIQKRVKSMFSEGQQSFKSFVNNVNLFGR